MTIWRVSRREPRHLLESVFVLLRLAGAVCLLLFGLRLVRDGATEGFGLRLRMVLGFGTRSRPRAFFSGLLATIGLQSSTATALMTADFAGQGMIDPRKAQIVLLGANLGTALTAWFVSAGITAISPVLIAAGYVLRRRHNPQATGLGLALIGVGVLLLAVTLLETASAPMRDSPALAAFLGLLGGALPVAFAVAAALAALCASSLAVIVLLLPLAAHGSLTPALSVAMVLGANFGGAIPPVLATAKAGAAARRVTLGNLAVRGIGCVIALPLAGVIGGALLQQGAGAAGLPVAAHLAFNVALALVIAPFAGALGVAMARAVPDDPVADADRPRWLDDAALSQPELALTGASREALAIGDIVERMMVLVMTAFRTNDPSPLREVAHLDDRVDLLQQAVKVYLARLSNAGGEGEKRRAIVVLDYVINLEHIGDILDKGLSGEAEKKIALGLRFSDEGYRELSALFLTTQENMRIAQTIFMSRDKTLARKLVEAKVDIRRMERASAERHFLRLRDGQADSLQTSSLHLDMLRDLKRINAHIASVAYPILDEEGLLVESRLKSSDGRAA
ncbi:MAG: Na/Pi cotransporter family protein [Paracoccaceae bacterium]|nr:Na/Pi cotransporter family protein [Paracoccaceae bacterium]